jgi:hypothetical protein
MSATREDIDQELAKLNESGHSIEELAQMSEESDGQQYLDFGDKLDLTLKGIKPTDSEIKIKAISRPIKGQLEGDDEVITVMVTARLDGTSTVNKRDGDGKVIAKTRRHILTPVSVIPVTAEQADQILGL